MRAKSVCLAWFSLHFLLLIAVSCHETLWLVARRLTILPGGPGSYSQRAERFAAAILGQDLPASSPLRQTLATYLSLAGIDAGYGYFAPNVPNSYRLIFELRYPDGHTEQRLPQVNRPAAGLRLASLLDQIGRTQSAALREHMVKTIAGSVWREHPEVKTIRATLSQIVQPTIAEYERGNEPTSEPLYIYDFSLDSNSEQTNQ